MLILQPDSHKPLQMFKDTLMKDIMSTFSFLDDHPDEDSVRPSPVPSYTPRPSPVPSNAPSLQDRDSPMQVDILPVRISVRFYVPNFPQ